jgi:hypothetical protein
MNVYELLDHTCEETYWTLGVFSTAEKANQHISEVFERTGEPPCAYSSEDMEQFVLKIVERPLDVEKEFCDCTIVSARIFRETYIIALDKYLYVEVIK